MDLIAHESGTLAAVGQAANDAAARAAFGNYKRRKRPNTLRTQAAALDAFARFVTVVGIDAGDLFDDPAAWHGVTWGMVAAFVEWMLAQGYALATVNGRLSAVKTYAGLAAKAGVIAPGEMQMIAAVHGYGRGEAVAVDEKRRVTRRGDKKAAAVEIDDARARQLKTVHDAGTASGRRDAAIMALLLDHGLRVGELVGLNVGVFNMTSGVMRFYRRKVNAWQTHRLTPAARAAVAAYLPDVAADGDTPLIQSATKHGTLTGRRMTTRGVRRIVVQLGAAVGIDGLSPHDCRHFWATDAAANRTDAFALQEAGGWASLAMPRRYVKTAEIANDGVRLTATAE